MWPFKRSTCPKGTIHVYECDGKYFKTEKEKEFYLFEKRKIELKQRFRDVVDGAVATTFDYHIPNKETRDRLADYFFENSYLFYQAIKIINEEHKRGR